MAVRLSNPHAWAEDDFVQAFDDYHAGKDTPHARAFKVILCSCMWRMARIEKQLEILGQSIMALAKGLGG